MKRMRLGAGCVFALAGCSLVGYDEQQVAVDHAQASDGGFAGSAVDATGAQGMDASATALDASAQPLDARFRHDGALEAGWWDGLTPDQVCTDAPKCYPTCDAALDSCVFDCAGAAECQNTCLPGTACEVACEHVGRCFMACKEGSQCWQSCQQARSCEGWCATGSHCQLDCAQSKSCHAMCLPGAVCELDCRAGANCSAFSCMLGAQCLVQCASENCDFACDGTGITCPNNVRACNRGCP